MNDESLELDGLRYRELRRRVAVGNRYFSLYFPEGFEYDLGVTNNFDRMIDHYLSIKPDRAVACARECALYRTRGVASCHGYCVYKDATSSTSNGITK